MEVIVSRVQSNFPRLSTAYKYKHKYTIQIQIHNTNTNIQSKYKIQCISVSRSQEGVARSPKAQDCTQLHLLSSCLHNAMHTIELILVLFHLAAKYSSHIILHPLLPPQRYAHQPLKPRWLPHLNRVAPYS